MKSLINYRVSKIMIKYIEKYKESDSNFKTICEHLIKICLKYDTYLFILTVKFYLKN